ncbi:hypothetical protein LOK49_LG04G02064 [Camellia lanceoleosa]|uniref:Uncharacterized protein n=1 Tax=Camellia lanceoleosa TaxID=1840588 RepID=A0ACC0I4P8_9ERIC|nr:hypothetical protein LOK49_LG04G02064 [Camellia lanceoleosa]
MLLRFQLEDAIEIEDFQEAARLKMAIVEATSKDSVVEIMSQMKRYHDDLQLCRCTGSGLVGWWVGYSNDSDDPFGRLIHITPGVGRFLGRKTLMMIVYYKQLVTVLSGTPLFEIFVVKDVDETYTIKSKSQKAFFQTKLFSQGQKSQKANPLPKRRPSVINFLKDKILELKLKVMKFNVIEEVIEDADALKQLMQEDSENTPGKDSDDETNNLVDGAIEDGKNLAMEVFIGGILRNIEDTSTKDECARLPTEIKDMERDSFVLHVPARGQDRDTDESIALSCKKREREARHEARGVSAQKWGRLSECTSFSQITSSEGDLDIFLRCKYGNWNCEDDNLDKTSDVEFFEYVEVVKLTGDLNVPAGQHLLVLQVTLGLYPDELGVKRSMVAAYKNQVLRKEIYKNCFGMGPYVKRTDLGFPYVVPKHRFLVLFNHLKLSE